VQSAATTSPLVQITSLKILLDKKIISQDEYDSALRDIGASSGTKGGSDANTMTVGKFATTIYGFIEADAIHDSTQSFTEVQGNGLVLRNETFGGQHGRLQGTVRNTRLGIRVKAPEFHSMRASAQLEMDFLGNDPVQLYPSGGAAGAISENSLYSNPTFRARHLNLKLETPIVDFLFGQYWNLFGWQPNFQPNTVEIQGIPGEIYSRRPQLRISKTIKSDPINFEIAVAALNPVQRDSEAPEMQAGVRIAFNNWKGKQTIGSTGTVIAPASIGISGDMKYVKLPVLAPTAYNTNDLVGSSIAFDAFLPIIPTSDEGKSGNNLSLTGEFATGYGMADQFTSFTGGVGFPATYTTQDIDNGIAAYDAAGNIHYVQWYTGIVGLQYYLPGVSGKIWVAANYSHMESPNTTQFGAPAKVRTTLDWINGSIFAEPAPGFRLGLSYSRTYDTYGDKEQPINDRVQGSAFFIF
jgi:hypothetical protein